MKCSKCQFEVEDEWNYCANCKTPISGLEYNPFSEKNFIEGAEQCNICATFIKDSWNYCPICGDLKKENEINVDDTVETQEIDEKGFCENCQQEVYIDEGVCRVCGIKIIKDPLLNTFVELLKVIFVIFLVIFSLLNAGSIGLLIVVIGGPFLIIGIIVAIIFNKLKKRFINKIKKDKGF